MMNPTRFRDRRRQREEDEHSSNNGSSSVNEADDDEIPGAFMVSNEGQSLAPPKGRLTRPPTFLDWCRGVSIRLSGQDNSVSNIISQTPSGGHMNDYEGATNVPASAFLAPTSNEQTSVEANDVQVLNPSNDKRIGPDLLAIVCCIIVIVGVAAGILFGVSPGKAGETDTDTLPPRSPLISESQRVTALREIVRPFSSDPKALDDPSSYQFDALTWLADGDEASIDLEDTKRLKARYALAAIYYATDGGGWTDQFGFLSITHECNWTTDANLQNIDIDDGYRRGVFCNDEGEVHSLNLDDNNLAGFVPEEIQALTSLRHFSIAHNSRRDRSSLDAVNSLKGISILRGNLQSLDASNNMWDSNLPVFLFERLTSLEVLHLENNELKFTIPSEIASLSTLRELYLDNNEGLIGSIEDPIENLPQLDILSARACSFALSPALRFPHTLKVLDLSGRIVYENGRSRRVGSSFDGSSLATTIGHLSNLNRLSLEYTELEGLLPTEIGKLTSLVDLELKGNSMMGTLPTEMMEMTSLAHLTVHGNSFRGETLKYFCNPRNSSQVIPVEECEWILI